MPTPTWYDLLDVDPTATTDEIRAAWKSAIADVDPTDRRFKTLSEAGAVLLDEDKRAAYDAELAEIDEPADAGRTEDDAGRAARPARAERVETNTVTEKPAATDKPKRTLPTIGWLPIACLAIVTLALVTSSVVSMARGGDDVITAANNNETQSTYEQNYGDTISTHHSTRIEESAQEALEAAKEAVVPLLSYDHKRLDEDKARAEAYLTDDYREDYDRIFALIEQNAPETKTVVQTLKPIDAGVSLASENLVEVLLFVDRPTTNKKTSEPIPYRDYVTLTMKRVDGKWLVDKMTTQPATGSDN